MCHKKMIMLWNLKDDNIYLIKVVGELHSKIY